MSPAFGPAHGKSRDAVNTTVRHRRWPTAAPCSTPSPSAALRTAGARGRSPSCRPTTRATGVPRPAVGKLFSRPVGTFKLVAPYSILCERVFVLLFLFRRVLVLLVCDTYCFCKSSWVWPLISTMNSQN